MGWWRAARSGASLQLEDTGLVWGDGPADIMGGAIDQIRSEYRESWGREPTIGELRAGLEFSLRRLPDETSAADLD